MMDLSEHFRFISGFELSNRTVKQERGYYDLALTMAEIEAVPQLESLHIIAS